MKGAYHRALNKCRDCDKWSYGSKKDAKRVLSSEHRGEHMNVFKCPYNSTWYHIGHLSAEVIAGEIDRDDRYGRLVGMRCSNCGDEHLTHHCKVYGWMFPEPGKHTSDYAEDRERIMNLIAADIITEHSHLYEDTEATA